MPAGHNDERVSELTRLRAENARLAGSLEAHGIPERFGGQVLEVRFAGTLRPDQEAAVGAMLAHDTGTLCAPTAFGKTVAAAAVITRRGVNTLVLVHRTELLKQWQERLQAFLGMEQRLVGTIGGGKSKPTGRIDIAVMQSLHRQGETSAQVENYGRQPIIFMQCGPGPTRHVAARPAGSPQTLEVVPRYLTTPIHLVEDAGSVRIIDFVDTGHPALLRMWDKRQRGYHAMGYRALAAAVNDILLDFDAVRSSRHSA